MKIQKYQLEDCARYQKVFFVPTSLTEVILVNPFLIMYSIFRKCWMLVWLKRLNGIFNALLFLTFLLKTFSLTENKETCAHSIFTIIFKYLSSIVQIEYNTRLNFLCQTPAEKPLVQKLCFLNSKVVLN